MSEECFLFGAIVAWTVKPEESQALDKFNADAIAKLPLDQEWPELIPAMFSFQTEEKGAARYRLQVIHFGGSYNHMSDGWHLFIDKFEALLRNMAWKEAHLFLEVELWGEHHFIWESKDSGSFDTSINKPRAVSQWSFEGGPRFLDPESVKSKSVEK